MADISFSQIRSLVARFGNEIVNEQAMLECPFVGEGILQKVKKKGRVGIVNIKAGAIPSGKFVADYGTLPSGGSTAPVQGIYSPVGIVVRLSIPRIAAKVADGEGEGVDIVKEEMDTSGETAGLLLGRGVVGNSLASPAASVAAGDTTFTVTDPSGFRVGMAFEVWNGSTPIEGTTEATLLTVTRVALPADPSTSSTVTITFTGSGAGSGAAVAWTTAYTLYLRGSKDSNATMVSMADIASSSGSLYGQAATTNEWSGNEDVPATATPLTIQRMRNNLTTNKRRRGRKKPDYVVCNARNLQRYSDQLINNRRFMNGNMDAVGDGSVEFEGMPFAVDENFGDADVYYHRQSDVKLHQWQDFQVEFDGGASPGMDRGALLVSDTNMTYDTQILGIFNMRCTRRNGVTRIGNITD